jgi:outer membrane protein OmpA-like peptidoglycan-associated protein
VAKTLLGIGILRISVDGHTDNQGSAALNQDLSERRAEATAQAFVAQGFKAGDITRRGFGFSRPVGDNNSEAGRQLNRRVTIIVSSL